jgi:hypothetical protein
MYTYVDNAGAVNESLSRRIGSCIYNYDSTGVVGQSVFFFKIVEQPSGTYVMIFQIFSPKNFAKESVFLTQNKAKF